MAFTNSFTGKGVAVNLPSGQGLQRAQEGMNALIMDAEKLKLDTFQKNEQEFLKNAQIDPVFSLSKSAMETQAKQLDHFNKTWAKVMQQKGNNMSTEDKVNMAAHKSYILEQQARMKSDMDRMQQDMSILDKDYMSRYDKEEWYNTHYIPFTKGESYSPDPLPIKSQDFVEWARTMAQKDRVETFDTVVHNKDGSTTTIYQNIPPNQVNQRVKQYIMAMPPAVAKNLLNERFTKAPDKQKYLDATDNKENAIVAWAQNQPDIVQAVVNEQRKTTLESKTGGGRTTFNWDLGIGAGHNKNAEYPVQPQVKLNTAYGVFDLPDMISLGVASQTTEQQQIPEMIEIKDGKEVITQINDAARFNIISYSPSKDVIFVKILDDGETVEQDEVIALPAARYDSLLKKKPFGIDRASLIKNQLSQPVKTKPKLY